jgi:hypothetical protein
MFSRINAGGWASGDPLTHTQANNLDIDHANALDKSTAGDTILGTVNVGGTGNVNIPILDALNWYAPVSVDATFALLKGAFCEKDQAWYGVGNGGSDWFMQSLDFGYTWTKPTLGSTKTCQDVACDASGNVLITNSDRSIYFGTRSAYGSVTFALTASALSANGTGTVAYDTTNTTWIAAYRNGALGQHLDTSTGGTSYTARTLPSSWTSYTGGNDARVASNASGTSIACFYDESAGLLRIIQSTNATTWTDVADASTGFAPGQVSKPFYDSVNLVWYIAISATGTRKTQIFYSTNGGTSWASSSWTTNDFCAQGLVTVKGWVVAINDDGRVAFSSAYGASLAFFWAGKAIVAASPITAAYGGGGVGIFYGGNKNFVRSIRCGTAGQSI